MKLKHILVLGMAAFFLWSGANILFPQAANAQSSGFSIPPSDTAGAVLWRSQREFDNRIGQPYLFRPITPADVLGPPPSQTPTIIYENGVLPEHRAVQGLLVTPGGKILIGPGQE